VFVIVLFCSDYEEDDRDESESIDNVDILSSLLISPLFNQEVSLLGTLIRCPVDWRKKRTFSNCARPLFRSRRYENDFFYSHANRTHFHEKGVALGLVLKVNGFGTRKWPVSVSICGWHHDYTVDPLLSPLPLISPPPPFSGEKS